MAIEVSWRLGCPPLTRKGGQGTATKATDNKEEGD